MNMFLSKCKRACVWALLMQKRLLKKISFIVILCMWIPLSALLRSSTKAESGVLTVALATEKSADALSVSLMNELSEAKGALRFVCARSAEDARGMVAQKEADAAWIFAADLGARLLQCAEAGKVRPLVTCVEGEESTALAFAREILYAKLYPHFSYAAYKAYTSARFPSVSERTLLLRYQRYAKEVSLFVFKENTRAPHVSYLLLPLRGLLSLQLLLCAFAAALYFMHDSARGAFVWVSSRASMHFSLCMLLVPVADCALLLLLSLKAGGVFAGLGAELLPLALLVLSSVLFADIVRLLLRTGTRVASLVPLLTLTAFIVCPIFIQTTLLPLPLRAIGYLLPPFYYLHAVYSPWFFGTFTLYTLALIAVRAAFSRMECAART